MVENRQLNNLINSMRSRLGCNDQDRWLAVTSLSFDLHAIELFVPLSCGATLVLASTEDAKSSDRLRVLEVQHQASIFQATLATWKMLAQVASLVVEPLWAN